MATGDCIAVCRGCAPCWLQDLHCSPVFTCRLSLGRVLLRVRMLYYLKAEVLGEAAVKAFEGTPARYDTPQKSTFCFTHQPECYCCRVFTCCLSFGNTLLGLWSWQNCADIPTAAYSIVTSGVVSTEVVAITLQSLKPNPTVFLCGYTFFFSGSFA